MVASGRKLSAGAAMANSGRCTLTINGYTCNVGESEHENMGHSFRGEPEPISGEAAPEVCICGHGKNCHLDPRDQGNYHQCIICPNGVCKEYRWAGEQPPQLRVEIYDPLKELREVAMVLAGSGDCIQALKIEAAIKQFEITARPVSGAEESAGPRMNSGDWLRSQAKPTLTECRVSLGPLTEERLCELLEGYAAYRAAAPSLTPRPCPHCHETGTLKIIWSAHAIFCSKCQYGVPFGTKYEATLLDTVLAQFFEQK
jgi:hypothetical protein